MLFSLSFPIRLDQLSFYDEDYSILTSRGIRKTSQVRSYAQKHSSKIKEDEVLKSASILHLLKNVLW